MSFKPSTVRSLTRLSGVMTMTVMAFMVSSPGQAHPASRASPGLEPGCLPVWRRASLWRLAPILRVGDAVRRGDDRAVTGRPADLRAGQPGDLGERHGEGLEHRAALVLR